jgi:hypothetical protein
VTDRLSAVRSTTQDAASTALAYLSVYRRQAAVGAVVSVLIGVGLVALGGAFAVLVAVSLISATSLGLGFWAGLQRGAKERAGLVKECDDAAAANAELVVENERLKRQMGGDQ